MLEILLAVLSGSAAAGMRLALPLVVIMLYGGDVWLRIPLLSRVYPPVTLGFLVSWSVLELVLSKDRVGQRLLQVIELVFSPLVGGIIGATIAQAAELFKWQVDLLTVLSALVTFVLQLVQVGWLYRAQRIPLYVLFAEDLICVLLILFAFDAPRQGGLIALLLLWLALRSAIAWRQWPRPSPRPSRPTSPLPDEHRDRD
jgi:hypothetical protein